MEDYKIPSDKIDRSPNSRIVRSAIDEVKAIRTLLEDSYKDFGGGRTLLRELVQNADDAEAERLVFAIVENGLPDAQNSLLRGPALLVANTGPFPARDRGALHQALGGSKAEDADKVGRFGIGLKSVFHICEAIVYIGADKDTVRPGALNPWAGTGASGDADPLHPDWDSVSDADMKCLLDVANKLLEKFRDGLLLWVPCAKLPIWIEHKANSMVSDQPAQVRMKSLLGLGGQHHLLFCSRSVGMLYRLRLTLHQIFIRWRDVNVWSVLLGQDFKALDG